MTYSPTYWYEQGNIRNYRHHTRNYCRNDRSIRDFSKINLHSGGIPLFYSCRRSDFYPVLLCIMSNKRYLCAHPTRLHRPNLERNTRAIYSGKTSHLRISLRNYIPSRPACTHYITNAAPYLPGLHQSCGSKQRAISMSGLWEPVLSVQKRRIRNQTGVKIKSNC